MWIRKTRLQGEELSIKIPRVIGERKNYQDGHNYLIRGRTKGGLTMWIGQVRRAGNSYALTIPVGMRRTLEMNKGEYYAMIVTEADTIEIRKITSLLENIKFTRARR